MRTIVVADKTLGKVPELVERDFVVGQRGNEHAIAHAFRTDVVVPNVDDVCHVVGRFKVDALVDRIALKKFAIGILNKLVRKIGTISSFNK